ncbi:MAG: (Fe-S)-binding protein [Verrucomicrobia bacterium]|nr:(Fe-S)-binding protein [Verrucomicrobiota bacterium]
MTANPAAPQRFLDEDKSLACVHCGLCLGACPTYLETGNENESPRGRIYLMRALQAGRLVLSDAAVRHIDLCLGCRACETACPSGVQYGALLEATRDHIEQTHRRSAFQRFLRRIAIERVFPFPARMKLALWPARLARKSGIARWLPKFLRDALSLVPANASSIHLPAVVRSTIASVKGRVGFIQGCVMSVMFGDTNAASVQLLNQAGWDVAVPPEQICCGALYAHSGNLERARECARRNIVAFEKLDLDAIVINAAGCGSTLKEYGHLLHDDPAWVERAERFSAKVKDLTEWLRLEDFKFQISNFKPVTYHDACHLAHPQRITKPPRDLIQAVVGKQFVELPESEVCCGSAGSYNLTEPEMAERLQRRKVENILKTGAEIVVTTNPGCILQMRAGLEKAGATHVRVLHIADFLAEAANPGPRAKKNSTTNNH